MVMLCGTHTSKHVDALENVQRRATTCRCIPSLKGLSYVDRLKKLQLPTLVYRRARGDMIETFKILNQYDPDVTPKLRLHAHTITRGHTQKLSKLRANKNPRKSIFSPSGYVTCGIAFLGMLLNLKMSFNLKNDLIYCGRTLNLNLIIRSLPRTAPTHQMLEDTTRSWT